MKVYTVTVEDRDGNQISSIRTCDIHEAEAVINEAKVANPNAMIVRTEGEATS